MGRLAARRHRRPRRDEVLRGVAALLEIIVLVVGVPVVLWLAVGWPLPHALPTAGEIRDALSGSSIPDGFFANALAVCTWLAWAQFVACLAVEGQSALRGRVPRRVPGAAWGGQRLAANLMAAAMLLLPTQGMAAAALAAAPVALVQTIHVQPRLEASPERSDGSASEEPGPAPDAGARAEGRQLPHYLVERRETLWRIAERHLGDPLRWREILELNQVHAQADGRRLEAMGRVQPGWVLRLPGDAVGVPRRQAATPVASSNSTPGLLAAGVIALLGALRVVQQRHRRAGRRIAVPGGPLVRVEAALRAGERPEQAELVALALRAMAAGIRREGLAAPRILGVLLRPERLQILLAEDTAVVPAPFSPSRSSRRRWDLPVDTPLGQLRELARKEASPVPALVTLGLCDEGLLLVNLEAAGLVALRGDGTAARATLASFALELVTCPWADFIEVILVGFGAELDWLERARRAGSVQEALPWLEHKASGVARALEESGVDSLLAGRVAGVTMDAWTPSVVLCAVAPSDEEAGRLAALTAVPSRSPIAAVIAGGEVAAGRWSLQLPTPAGQPVHFAPLDLDVVPQRLDLDGYRSIVGLLQTAVRSDVEPERERPAVVEPVGAPPEVEVRVLGRVEIAGIDRVERGKSEELVVFLAFHPAGVDADQLSEALWPGRPPARGTLNTTTAVARAHLGLTLEGAPRLPHARSGLYRLDASVGLDWSRFQALAARGYDAGDEGAADLRRALELVRGRPFEGAKPRSYGWAQLEEVPVMEAAIVDVADHLAGLSLRAGDLTGAQWAARRGLATAPYDERLYRRLMLIADAAGNPAGVEAVMDELLLRLDEEHFEPYDSLHEETRALYARLMRHRAGRHRDAG